MDSVTSPPPDQTTTHPLGVGEQLRRVARREAQRLQRHQAAEAVADHPFDIALAQALRKPRDGLPGPAAHAGIAEQDRCEALAPQPRGQRTQPPLRVEQAVHQQHAWGRQSSRPLRKA